MTNQKTMLEDIKPVKESSRAWKRFKANKRGYYSLWLFIILFGLSLFAEILSNDKPLLVYYENSFYAPIFKTYPETTFAGDFETEADYVDPFVKNLLNENGNWAI